MAPRAMNDGTGKHATAIWRLWDAYAIADSTMLGTGTRAAPSPPPPSAAPRWPSAPPRSSRRAIGSRSSRSPRRHPLRRPCSPHRAAPRVVERRGDARRPRRPPRRALKVGQQWRPRPGVKRGARGTFCCSRTTRRSSRRRGGGLCRRRRRPSGRLAVRKLFTSRAPSAPPQPPRISSSDEQLVRG